MKTLSLLSLVALCILPEMTSPEKLSEEAQSQTESRRFPRGLRDVSVPTELADIRNGFVQLEDVVVKSSRGTTRTLGVPLSRISDVLSKFTLYSSLYYARIQTEVTHLQRNNTEQLSCVRNDIEEVNRTLTQQMTEIKDHVKSTTSEIITEQEIQRERNLNEIRQLNRKLDAMDSDMQSFFRSTQLAMDQLRQTMLQERRSAQARADDLAAHFVVLNFTMQNLNQNFQSPADGCRSISLGLNFKLAEVRKSLQSLRNNVSSSLSENKANIRLVEGKLDSLNVRLGDVNSTAHLLLTSSRDQTTRLEQGMHQLRWNISGKIDLLRSRLDGAGSSRGNLSALLDTKLGAQTNRLLEVLPSIMRRSAIPVEGDLRLVNGSSFRQGRLEIFHDDRWGTVCDDNFGSVDAEVACRSLDLPSSNVRVHVSAYFGRGSGPIWMDDVACTASTAAFHLCPKGHNWGSHNCNHGEDVGVTCA